jgi:uncharacterized protein (TIGR03086 family)
MSNELHMLERALDQTGALIEHVRPEQPEQPTPCSEWNVRQLVNHIVHDVQSFKGQVEGKPYQQRTDDVLGADWSATYRTAADELLVAWRQPGAIERQIKLPFGEFPATWQAGQHITDLVVHAWDVGRATDQPVSVDDDLVQYALDWGRENLKPQFRGQAFGAEVHVAGEAPVYDRLVGFFGRDPSWKA